MAKKNILLLAGDGIGPEIMEEAKKIISWFNKNKELEVEIAEELVGGISDRKSTRLNSSHDQISYAVFCLKKKKKKLNTE